MLNSGSEAAIIQHRPGSCRANSPTFFARLFPAFGSCFHFSDPAGALLETEPIVLPHCEFMEIRHINPW
jgi:hypothetical protein